MNSSECAVKGGVVRGYARWLVKRAGLDAVKRRVDSHTAAMLDAPPLASEWVPVVHTIAIIEAVAALWGPRAVRDMNLDGLRTTLVAVTMPVLGGLSRVFGVSPATLYSRMTLIMKSNSRGFQFTWQPSSATSGLILVHSSSPLETPVTAEAWAAGFDLLMEVSGAKGTVVVSGVTPDPRGAVMRFEANWA